MSAEDTISDRLFDSEVGWPHDAHPLLQQHSCLAWRASNFAGARFFQSDPDPDPSRWMHSHVAFCWAFGHTRVAYHKRGLVAINCGALCPA